MTIEQRKIALINWIANLNNESYLLKMEELKHDFSQDIPQDIRDLLTLSAQTPNEKLIRHTSVKDLKK